MSTLLALHPVTQRQAQTLIRPAPAPAPAPLPTLLPSDDSNQADVNLLTLNWAEFKTSFVMFKGSLSPRALSGGDKTKLFSPNFIHCSPPFVRTPEALDLRIGLKYKDLDI